MKSLIRNCRLISPGVELNHASILIDGEFIKAVYPGKAKLPAGIRTFNAGGMMAVPGFIDIHFHGAAGYDVTDASLKGMTAIAQAKLDEGVTSILPTTLTLPEEKLSRALKSVSACMKKKTGMPRIHGVHLEGPFINSASTGAQNPAFVRPPDIAEVMRLNQIAPVKKLSFAPEAEGGFDFVQTLLANGIVPSCGHSAADFASFSAAHNLGLRNLTHFCNQMTRLHHRETGLVGAGLYYDDVYTEIICDKVHLCPSMIELIFKVKPLESILLITDSISASWLEDGKFSLGGLDLEVSDGAARLASNGALAGSTLRFYDAFRNVCELSSLPACELVRTTSLNQAESLGLSGLGRIEPGYYADITLLDDNFIPSAVFVAGKQAK